MIFTKGTAWPYVIVVSLVFIVLSAIFLFVFVSRVDEALCNGDVQACRTAVQARYESERLGNVIPVDVPSNCKGKPITFERESPADVNRIISEELERCIVKFHEGTLDFSKGSLLGAPVSDQYICYRCAAFDFSQYQKREEYAAEGDLLQYFQSKTTSCSQPQQKILDYLRGLGGAGKGKYMYPNVARTIDPSVNYILFVSIWKPSRATTIGDWLTERLYGEPPPAVSSAVNLVRQDAGEVRKCTGGFYQ